mgnify:CR=1 FL=1
MHQNQEVLRIQSQLHEPGIKLGDLRKIAKEIKKNHSLAMVLWSTKEFLSRELATLIMDPQMLTQEVINQLDQDIQLHPQDEQLHLIDWLMANQLSKDKKTIDLMLSWENSTSDLQRRIFWYYQARLRWVGQTPPLNTEKLLTKIEKHIESEVPSVQWAINFTAAQIGISQEEYRDRCIDLGIRTGLYKNEVVPKNCTPSYLPDFISIQVAKLKK